MNTADYNRAGHSKYSLKVHIILATKYRKKYGFDDYIKQYLYNSIKQYNAEIIEMETDLDHVHILLKNSTTMYVADIIKMLKQYSTYAM